MEIKTLKDLKYAYKHKYTDLGSYPLFVLLSDGGCLCHTCVQSEYREMVDAIKTQSHNGWLPVAIDVNYESLEYCDHCDERIETAYGVYGNPNEQSRFYFDGASLKHDDYCGINDIELTWQQLAEWPQLRSLYDLCSGSPDTAHEWIVQMGCPEDTADTIRDRLSEDSE